MNGLEVAEALRTVKQPAGRMQLISGLNDSLIVDDTYNASPDSVFEGLKALREIPQEKRRRVFALLGSMKELGELSRQGHEDIASAASEISDFIIGVGEEAKVVSDLWFADSEMAGEYVAGKLEPGDLIYVKGSQAARMEKAVKRLMAQPENAGNLLVRQGKEWER